MVRKRKYNSKSRRSQSRNLRNLAENPIDNESKIKLYILIKSPVINNSNDEETLTAPSTSIGRTLTATSGEKSEKGRFSKCL